MKADIGLCSRGELSESHEKIVGVLKLTCTGEATPGKGISPLHHRFTAMKMNLCTKQQTFYHVSENIKPVRGN